MTLRMATIALGILAAASAFDAWAGSTPDVETFMRATETLSASVEAAKASGGALPSLSNPEQAALFRVAFDSSVLPKLDWGDLPATVTYCARAGMIGDYITADLDPVVMGQPMSPATIAKLNANAARFHDELALMVSFNIDCTARLMATASVFWASLPDRDRTPTRLAGLRRIRNGASQVLQGAITSLTEPQNTSANKSLILDAFGRSSSALGAALAPTQRQALVSTINSALPDVSPDAARILSAFRETLKRMPCEGFCAI